MDRGVRGNRALEASVLASLSVIAGLFGAFSIVRVAGAYTPRGPIYIEGDVNFTATNGVTGGSGTPSDPYVIEGWDVIGSGGVTVRNTRASFVVRDTQVSGPTLRGVTLFNVANALVGGNVSVLSADMGIVVTQSSNVTIARNTLTSLRYSGIELVLSSEIRVEGNDLARSETGLNVVSSSYVTIVANRFSEHLTGVRLLDALNVTAGGNVFDQDGIYLAGSELAHFNTHEIGTDNTVNGQQILYYKNCVGPVDLDGVAAGQVIIANCTSVRVANAVFGDTDVGVEMAYVADATIDGNTFTSTDAVTLWNATRVFVTGNRAATARYGVNLVAVSSAMVAGNELSGGSLRATLLANSEVSNNTLLGGAHIEASGLTDTRIVDNSVAGSLWEGIEVAAPENVTVSRNRLSANPIGLAVGNGDRIWIEGNEIADGWYGITAWETSNLTVVANRVRNHTYGAVLTSSSVPTRSRDGRIHHNYFLWNGAQAIDENGENISWDDGYPSGGNYWSDYAGPDFCSGPLQDGCPNPDGIGDVPYALDGDSRDRYPLVYLPPETRLDVGAPNATAGARYVTSATPLMLTATDRSGTGINRTEYRVDLGTWTPTAGPVALGGEGVHLLEWFSEDNLGRSEAVQSEVLRVDDTPPSPAIAVGEPKVPGTRTFVTSSTPITLAAPDGGPAPVGTGEIEYRLGGGPWTPYADPVTLSGADGPVVVDVRAADLLGNAAATSEELALDDTPPSSTLTPGSGAHPVGTEFDLAATDAGSGVALREYRVDAGTWTPFAGPFTVPEGSHVIEYRSSDRLGNAEEPRRAEVTIGSTEPPSETPQNWKPALAVAFCAIILAAAFVRRRRNADRRTLALHVPFLALEASIGGISWASGVLAVPPWLGAGTIVNTAIVAAALLVPWLLSRERA